MSGLEDHSHNGYQNSLYTPLWSSSLGITGSCQYTTSQETCEQQRSHKGGLSFSFFNSVEHRELDRDDPGVRRVSILSADVTGDCFLYLVLGVDIRFLYQGSSNTAMTSSGGSASVQLRASGPWA